MDYKQCFDSMWLKETTNDMYTAVVHTVKLDNPLTSKKVDVSSYVRLSVLLFVSYGISRKLNNWQSKILN